jgi:hypothetical protein
MKKQAKKLMLTKETLRGLDSRNLVKVRGLGDSGFVCDWPYLTSLYCPPSPKIVGE